MFDPVDLLFLLVAGCTGGILAGMLGIGGGMIYVVVITTYLQKFDPGDIEIVKYTVSNSLFAVFFAGLAASAKQIRKDNFYPREVLITGIPGIAGALLIAYFVINFDWYSRERFTLFFIVMLSFFAYRMFLSNTKKGKDLTRNDLPGKSYAYTGFFSGVLSGLSGLGGGVIIIPVLSGFMRLRIIKSTSVSLGIMPIYTLAISIFYAFSRGPSTLDIPYTFGYIIFPLVLPLSLGVILFAPLGVRIAHKLPPRAIKIIFGIIMILVILKMADGLVNYL